MSTCLLPFDSEAPGDERRPLSGLIQHSFGLQLSETCRPFRGRTNSERITERFAVGEFQPTAVGALVDLPNREYAGHSSLANSRLTTLDCLQPEYVGPERLVKELPPAFAWAGRTATGPAADRFEEPRLIFADRYDDERSPSFNDFLIRRKADSVREPTSQVLLELMAHKRSRLFGFPLANRIVNVMLPHAVLTHRDSPGASANAARSWFMQPLVSFVRGGHDRARLRNTYSLTFFLVPVLVKGVSFSSRATTQREIAQMTNAGWDFAASPPSHALLRFEVSGLLLDYLSALARLDLHDMPPLAGGSVRHGKACAYPRGHLTLRQTIERVAFGVGLSLAQGRVGRARDKTMHVIGSDIAMSLGAARVSSVVVEDADLQRDDVIRPARYRRVPRGLGSLLKALADPVRVELRGDRKGHQLRLDRPFIDGDGYAFGVLPVKRVLAFTNRTSEQFGVRESGLIRAGSIAYMTIGAATAIGTMRQIDQRLERLEGADDPKKIAEIDAEIATDLGEIYDLDITRQSYRETYRHLRDRLGVTRDYEILQGKMEALYRATSTFHEEKANRLLTWLTAAIVILSVFILIGTVVLAGKG